MSVGRPARTFLTMMALAGLAACRAAPPARPGPTPEPLVPTATPGAARLTPSAAAPTTLKVTPMPTLPPVRSAERWRFGVGIPSGQEVDGWLQAVGAGWYLTWGVGREPHAVPGVEQWQVVRLAEHGLRPSLAVIVATAQRHPGLAWLIGNEPDVRWQDAVTPERYAELYRVLYRNLKAADPTARVYAGGIAQATPLRLAYLDRVLAAYRESFGESLPADGWAIHAFVLREARDSWGVDIPPGLPDAAGELYEVGDHADRAAFRGQIVAFRGWMAARGYRALPLAVSEYGILMPGNYGFPPEAVEQFLRDSFDFFLTATDPGLGDPADGGRLVQRWCWYSLADTVYPTGNLVDLARHQLTPLGWAYRGYVEALP